MALATEARDARELRGVAWEALDEPLDPGPTLDAAARLIDAGVRFRSAAGAVPWLVAERPFPLGATLRAQLEALGRAVCDYFDRLQELYRDGHPVVRRELDGLTAAWLCGLEVDRPLEMFRLDVVLERGRPWITEVEETFGNAGKTIAMERAYGLPAGPLVELLATRGIERILVCDDFPEYLPELEIVARHLRAHSGRAVSTELFSTAAWSTRGPTWRFATVAELQRYGRDWLDGLLRSGLEFVNPLFHGYGTKAAIALVHDDRVAADLDGASVALLRDSVPATVTLPRDTAAAVGTVPDRRGAVLKVMECPGAPELTWGSRGVIFGERSRRDWDARLADARAGRVVASDGRSHGARLALCALVESDRFDVNFLHPVTEVVCRMPRARCRLGPIFVRSPAGVTLTGGHATFVNTSRKVHLGAHAVCAPLDLSPAKASCTPSS